MDVGFGLSDKTWLPPEGGTSLLTRCQQGGVPTLKGCSASASIPFT